MTVILVIKPDTVYRHLKNKQTKKIRRNEVSVLEYMAVIYYCHKMSQNLPSDPQTVNSSSKEKKKPPHKMFNKLIKLGQVKYTDSWF